MNSLEFSRFTQTLEVKEQTGDEFTVYLQLHRSVIYVHVHGQIFTTLRLAAHQYHDSWRITEWSSRGLRRGPRGRSRRLYMCAHAHPHAVAIAPRSV